MFQKNFEISMLYDFYGQLLTDKKNEIMNMYYNEDYSLGEIADTLEISRQAVHDSIKSSEKALKNYEDKLGLAEKFSRTGQCIEQVKNMIDSIMADRKEDVALCSRLEAVEELIRNLD